MGLWGYGALGAMGALGALVLNVTSLALTLSPYSVRESSMVRFWFLVSGFWFLAHGLQLCHTGLEVAGQIK